MVREARTLEQLLDQIDEARTGGDRVALEQIMDAVGRRSFGPLLLVAGLTVLAPLVGGIPGVPTAIGLFVAILAVQLIAGRDTLWLTRWLLNRSVASDKRGQAARCTRWPAIERSADSVLFNMALGSAGC